MRLSIPLLFVTAVGYASPGLAQAPSSTPTAGEVEDDGVVVIDTPPQPPPPALPTPVPSEGVVLQRPGRVLLYGKPIRLDFRSPTDGVAFSLLAGGSYSQISGVSYGVGFGGYGYGYGGFGYGGYGFGIAPYYGDIVTKAYQPICEAPCQATLLSGNHRMALSLRGGAPVDVRQPVSITEDAIVEGRYVDKSRLRKTGWAIFVSGAVAGMVMMFASVNYDNDPFNTGDQIRNRPVFYTGVGLFVSSIIAGSVLASQDDEAYINVYPVK